MQHIADGNLILEVTGLWWIERHDEERETFATQYQLHWCYQGQSGGYMFPDEASRNAFYSQVQDVLGGTPKKGR